ncbi:hypothetical protein L2E82_49606 [Cichorium intybus]|uniref:Uncharacterized protein n=1 Tax=Cichorium intybus TaxID=13427 RepID=A0ACB8Z511_CICIN|nr:hypothetical protein L2E82_49606 [Cichorium intybus]
MKEEDKGSICISSKQSRFFPDKATTLALDLLNELVKELRKTPCPIVFVYFSGGPKACMYKALQELTMNFTNGKIQQFMICYKR